MIKYSTCAFLLTLALAQHVLAAGTDVGSNIGLSAYPGPPCTKPQLPAQPTMPANASGQAAQTPAVIGSGGLAVAGTVTEPASAKAYNLQVQNYNKAVAAYNAAIRDFNSCMQIYIDNGNADMMRIKQRLEQAVADSNAH
jgi:hypothetical protein